MSRRLAVPVLCLAAALPFVPGTLEFVRRGVPDILFTGDGAALELRTLHAVHGAQFVGPYSQFRWSHPGPLFFYLAAPAYEFFDRHGPALNLFAFGANLLVAMAIVLVSLRLRGAAFALVAASLLAVYSLAAAPFLLANEWNPIFPILPFALFTLIAVRFALGADSMLPALAFIGSLVVQTHVGYAPEILATSAAAAIIRRRRAGKPLTARLEIAPSLRVATAAILIVCWAPPIYEALTQRPGNLQRLIAFFTPRHLAEQSWRSAIVAAGAQLSVMPLAIARTLRIGVGAMSPAVLLLAAGAQIVALAAIVARARRRGDDTLRVWGTLVLVQIAVAVLAVRAIRGEIHPYLVAWVSVLGLLTWLALASFAIEQLRRKLPKSSGALAAALAIALLAGVMTEPVARGPVFREPDADAEHLARTVDAFVRDNAIDRPTIEIASESVWPSAVASVLYLYKRDVAISVADEWIFMVGRPLAAAPGAHRAIVFGDREFDERARARGDLVFVTAVGHVFVYVER